MCLAGGVLPAASERTLSVSEDRRITFLTTPSMGRGFQLLPFPLCKVGTIIMLFTCFYLPSCDSSGPASLPQPAGSMEVRRHCCSSMNVAEGSQPLPCNM